MEIFLCAKIKHILNIFVPFVMLAHLLLINSVTILIGKGG